MKKVLVLASLAISLPAFAATDTSNMSVSASVSDVCVISAGALSFGAYDPVSGAAVNGTATLSVACTEGASADVTLDQGANPDSGGGSTAAAPLRQMISGSDLLAYTLFQDSGRTTVWGDTSDTAVGYLAADSSEANITVYGTITGSQSVPSGSYGDTVVATITF